MASYDEQVHEVTALIDKATSELRADPDWQINMAVSDIVNSNSMICDVAVKLIVSKIQCNSGKVVLLALTLIETLMKNGSETLHVQVSSRQCLNEIASLTDGSMGFDVQTKALSLIKQWGEEFTSSSLTSFHDTYRQLKLQGAVFPEQGNDVPIFDRATSASSSSSKTSGKTSDKNQSSNAQLQKLHDDLKVVVEKIHSYKDLRTKQKKSEEIEDVLDFLRQCQLRMNTLIEGGLSGRLDEKTLEKCLNVNDSLIKAINNEYTGGRDLTDFDSSTDFLSEPLSNVNINQAGNSSSRIPISSTMHSTDDDFDSFLHSRSNRS